MGFHIHRKVLSQFGFGTHTDNLWFSTKKKMATFSTLYQRGVSVTFQDDQLETMQKYLVCHQQVIAFRFGVGVDKCYYCCKTLFP